MLMNLNSLVSFWTESRNKNKDLDMKVRKENKLLKPSLKRSQLLQNKSGKIFIKKSKQCQSLN